MKKTNYTNKKEKLNNQNSVDISSIKTILKDANLKITGPRLAISSVLLTSENHPTAIQIFEEVKSQFTNQENISLATVYKTLEKFEQKGLVSVFISGDGKSHYEPRRDPHINLICIKCGKITDMMDDKITQFVHDIYKMIPNPIQMQNLSFFYVCDMCNSN
ncbi:MAG: transcriptional repressor [Candidatus Lokiarchaeota archaeon]|nr:transcriptional repressor [Candidatus Harpocratesius repetitus]